MPDDDFRALERSLAALKPCGLDAAAASGILAKAKAAWKPAPRHEDSLFIALGAPAFVLAASLILAFGISFAVDFRDSATDAAGVEIARCKTNLVDALLAGLDDGPGKAFRVGLIVQKQSSDSNSLLSLRSEMLDGDRRL